jgi:radical SAM superfamily enzyme YgiQ (UPF0313 family)
MRWGTSNKTKIWDKNSEGKINIMVNPTPYYLHGYFKKHYPDYANYINWKPSILIRKTEDELLEYLVDNDIDVFCISLYIWNAQHCLDIIANLKSRYNKKLTIVAGGPSCDADKDDWGELYPYIDHCIVGQGEKAWCNLALDFIGAQTLNNSATNIVHFLKKDGLPAIKSYEYEFIRGIHYSAFIECEDLIHELQAVYPEYNLEWPYETQRGCPYHCTFCDWNGGQSNKTQKRKEVNFIDEIDFFNENKMYSLYFSDANFGMWDVDVDIIKRMVYHNQNNGANFKSPSFNLSKIVNNNHKEILSTIIEHDLHTGYVKLSVQDVHDHVLDAIDRPGNWAEHKAFGISMYEKFSEKKNFRKMFVEIIAGLPMQTYESFINNLDEIYSNGFIPRTYPFLMLKNAPATYDVAYKEKYQIVYDYVFEAIDNSLTGSTVEEIINNPSMNPQFQQIISTNTFTQDDLVKMAIADQLYRRICSRMSWAAYGFIDVNWSHLKPLIMKLMDTDDYRYIVNERCNNFAKYRINAMNGAHGKILLDGNDISSLVYRHLDLVKNSFNETGMDESTQAKFFEVYNTFEYAKDYLDR